MSVPSTDWPGGGTGPGWGCFWSCPRAGARAGSCPSLGAAEPQGFPSWQETQVLFFLPGSLFCVRFSQAVCWITGPGEPAGRREAPAPVTLPPGRPRVQGRPRLRSSQSGSWLHCGAGPGAHPEGPVAHPMASGAWGCPVWVTRASEPRAFPGEAAQTSVERTWDPAGCWGLVVCSCSLETPRSP